MQPSFLPSRLYSFLFRQEIKAVDLGTSHLVLRTKAGNIQIAYDDLPKEPVVSGLIFQQVAFPDTPYAIKGLTGGRGSVLAEQVRQHRQRAYLLGRWPEYARAAQDWKHLTAAEHYIARSEVDRWLTKQESLALPEEAELREIDVLRAEERDTLLLLVRARREHLHLVREANSAFETAETKRFATFFDSVEKNPLTGQQRLAVVRDEDNNLVMAGAGTGKTSTIMAKVGYILKRGLAHPEEILLLAFTRKAAEEMRERIEERLKMPVQVRTFHGLGMEILGEADGKRPSLAAEAEDDKKKFLLLGSIVDRLAHEDERFRQGLVELAFIGRVPYKEPREFGSLGEYYNYLKAGDLRTLNGDRVKSQEELMIANWLTLNGVDHRYEQAYEYDTATSSHRQYKPDFILTQSGIYIEHFGVDRDGNAPSYMDPVSYREGMRWKRALHQEMNTQLVETYSWEAAEGVLFSNLRTKLEERGVILQPLSSEEVLNLLKERDYFNPIVKVIQTFLSLFKGGGYTSEELERRAKKARDGGRSKTFVSLFKQVYQLYEQVLASREEIDFEDMIRRAVDAVRARRFVSKYRYIIVDEYQDIARGRADLLRELRAHVQHSRLFVVGDDWQSIYRFTGADVTLMTQFEQAFGATAATPLDQTFRFNDAISRFSEKFILRNPAQMRKSLRSPTKVDGPRVTIIHAAEKDDPLNQALSTIADETDAASVFVLNRYNFDMPDRSYREGVGLRFPSLQVRFLTAHGSKGLEADYVVIDNMRCGRFGFPSEICDDPLLDLVLAKPDGFEHSEERRLFYVALTRCRKRAFLINTLAKPSAFISEILNDDRYLKVVTGAEDAVPSPCPVCKTGLVVPRDGSHGRFYGCTHFPLCSYKEDACPRCRKGRLVREGGNVARCSTCQHEGHVCPRCGRGLLVLRKGPYGQFYGCSMYGREMYSCEYKCKSR